MVELLTLRQTIRRGHSNSQNTRQAVREFYEAVIQPDLAMVTFFCSPEYDLEILANEMRQLFEGIQVIGCTTAGEIGPAGYLEKSLSGASFPADSFSVVTGELDKLQQFTFAGGQSFAKDLLAKLQTQTPVAGDQNSFAFLLIDGLSVKEEPVAHALQSSLGAIPVFGGSAGDGLKFGKTYVYHDGAFHTDSAVVALVSTDLPFKLFKTQHFIAGEERLVVTQADAAHRVVNEINGLPAAEEYARLVGLDAQDLNPMRFAASPVVVLIDGTDYVRSIQTVHANGDISFLSAIEEGLVLRVARGVDLVQNLDQAFADVVAAVGKTQLVIGCDCILRYLEINQRELTEKIARTFMDHNVVGFGTYGEQYMGMHVNQTFVGLAIGCARESYDA